MSKSTGDPVPNPMIALVILIVVILGAFVVINKAVKVYPTLEIMAGEYSELLNTMQTAGPTCSAIINTYLSDNIITNGEFSKINECMRDKDNIKETLHIRKENYQHE